MQQQAQSADPGHLLRGVSVSYFSSTFLHEVQAAGLPQSAKVHELAEPVIHSKGAHIICPRDGLLGAAYVDCIAGAGAGHADVMLSYTWNYTAADIADGLMQFCQKTQRDPATTFVWICCLCINQHRVKEAVEKGEVVPFEVFREAFESRVRGIGHIVALMAPWSAPSYITRVWCIFELFTAVTVEGCTFEVTMPAAEAAAMRASLLQSYLGCYDLFQALGAISVQHAQSTVLEDKVRILRLIQDGPGYDYLNRKVTSSLRDWVLSICESHLKEGRASGDADVSAVLLNEVGWLQYSFGNISRAEELFIEAKKARSVTNTLESPDGALVLSNIGLIKTMQGKLKEALIEYEESRRIRTAIGSLQNDVGADLIGVIGLVKAKQGHPEAALVEYAEAKRIRVNTGTYNGPGAVFLHLRIGNAKKMQGDHEGALEEFFKGNQMCMTGKGRLLGPATACLLTAIGQFKREQGDNASALHELMDAKRIFLATGQSGRPDYAELLIEIGKVLHIQGDPSAALAEYMEAQKIYVDSGLFDTPETLLLAQEMRLIRDTKQRGFNCFALMMQNLCS